MQDKFLPFMHNLGLPFYLTGGTALGRFYLNHRYSEDLDFFVNADPLYQGYIGELKKEITACFKVDIKQALFAQDITRFFIEEDGMILKIEFINDVSYRPDKPEVYTYGKIDTPLNILSNKLTAIVSRDEPKDVFDIIHISKAYSFNWKDVFYHAKQKAAINEIDLEQRLVSFPVKLLESVHLIIPTVNYDSTKNGLRQIADDFLLGKDNSQGNGKKPIETAKPWNG